MPSEGNSEVARYRRAAEAALQQIDWCVDYLLEIRKRREATALARNRDQIRRKLMRERTPPPG